MLINVDNVSGNQQNTINELPSCPTGRLLSANDGNSGCKDLWEASAGSAGYVNVIECI